MHWILHILILRLKYCCANWQQKKKHTQISNFLWFYFSQDGGRGHLEGLASVYCEMLMAPFGDVLTTLEDARQRAWSDRSPSHSAGMIKGHRGSSNQIGSLPNSHSQPIYVPGKYLVRYIDYDILNVFGYNGIFP